MSGNLRLGLCFDYEWLLPVFEFELLKLQISATVPLVVNGCYLSRDIYTVEFRYTPPSQILLQ